MSCRRKPAFCPHQTNFDGSSKGKATYPGWADSVGAWSKTLTLDAGVHTLTANAVHPSGHYTATANATFTVNVDAVTLATAYDDDGNVTSRTWSNGTIQLLTWDAFNRLIKVSQRDGSNNGYDWTAVYDGLGRRLQTTQQAIAANAVSGSPTVTTSIYDPQVEFLEIGVAVNGAKAWKVYGPDLNGRFGGLQGTGGLEATILDADGTAKGVLSDAFGNGVASVTGSQVSWFASRAGAYGPLPDIRASVLTDSTCVAEATAWRSRRIDPTGFYNLGARYYEPTTGRFLSPDPMGHAASMSLYDYCNGDPVNQFDPDGRFGKQVGQGLAKFTDTLINFGIGTFGVGHPDGFTEEEIANERKMMIEDYGSWLRRLGAYNETVATNALVEQLPANLSPAAMDVMMSYAALRGAGRDGLNPPTLREDVAFNVKPQSDGWITIAHPENADAFIAGRVVDGNLEVGMVHIPGPMQGQGLSKFLYQALVNEAGDVSSITGELANTNKILFRQGLDEGLSIQQAAASTPAARARTAADFSSHIYDPATGILTSTR